MPIKLSTLGIPELKPGKHNIKDPRLDGAHALVEADKKTYAQVDVVGEEGAADADALVVTPETRADLILQDLEFIETRLGRNPPDAEKVVLLKMQKLLEGEQFLFNSGLSAEELGAVAAHSFATNKPVIVAETDERAEPEKLILRAFQGSGYICFLTVGGKENRAWPIRKGTTAWEAAGSIHTDLQKGFIRAEIIGYDDFIAAGGETQAKRANKLRLETKTYVMQDYDLVNFRFSK
jgi:ribosome-binding ATPase YchF (GTP1/OBG family)